VHPSRSTNAIGDQTTGARSATDERSSNPAARARDRVGARRHVKPRKDPRVVPANGLDGEAEALTDDPIASAVGEPAKNLEFARRLID